jgi:predicted AAA+ superfamily ATPase
MWNKIKQIRRRIAINEFCVSIANAVYSDYSFSEIEKELDNVLKQHSNEKHITKNEIENYLKILSQSLSLTQF